MRALTAEEERQQCRQSSRLAWNLRTREVDVRLEFARGGGWVVIVPAQGPSRLWVTARRDEWMLGWGCKHDQWIRADDAAADVLMGLLS